MSAGDIIHPYYPVGAKIVGYSANETPILTLLAFAAAGSTALLGTTWGLTRISRPSLSRGDTFAIFWFVLCMKLPFDLRTN